jgi:hypothetical protein
MLWSSGSDPLPNAHGLTQMVGRSEPGQYQTDEWEEASARAIPRTQRCVLVVGVAAPAGEEEAGEEEQVVEVCHGARLGSCDWPEPDLCARSYRVAIRCIRKGSPRGHITLFFVLQ